MYCSCSLSHRLNTFALTFLSLTCALIFYKGQAFFSKNLAQLAGYHEFLSACIYFTYLLVSQKQSSTMDLRYAEPHAELILML